MLAPEQPMDDDPVERREASCDSAMPHDMESAGRFLRAIGKVVRDRMLYPANHPQTLVGVAALREAVRDLFGERNERVFVVIGDQVFVDDRLLGTQGQEGADLAATLRERGVGALIVRRGLTIQELQPFLDSMAMPRSGVSQPFCFRSDHLILGDVRVDEEGNPVPGAIQELGAAISKSAAHRPKFDEEAKILRDTYLDWTTAQEVLLSHVDRVMGTLETQLFANFHSFIPLAELKSHDEYTYVHALNLAMLTMAQAESLGFSKEAIHAFGIGALLHDVGKTQVSIDVLHKAGKLTPEELEVMKGHPIHGAALLLKYPQIPKVAAIVAYEHHLRFNRTGYPTMRRERPQYIASRLVAIADHFDAMRSNRPYRDAMEPDQIFEIMEKNKGTELDPRLVDHFFGFMKTRKM